MTKGLPIEPGAMLSMGALHLSDIPVNAYQKPLQEERSRYTTEELVDIWRDMCAIREFETILNELKLKGTYRGVAYDHAGPAHLSIGQEGAAVGMAFSLTPEDHIFGSHRSHGEILAKAFSAMRFLSDEQLEDHALIPRGGRARPGGGAL
jgi:2-oxoisovalerate dehydrogenase E1 component